MPRLSEAEGGLIKPPNYTSDYTEEQAMELFRCTEDPLYFIRKYVKIQHPTRGALFFDLRDYQEALILEYHNNLRTISLISRQTGKCCHTSTTIKINNKNKEIGSLFNLNFRARIVTFLNKIKLKLARYILKK